MNFTLWVTRNCNLNCSYCYVNKKDADMTIDTADKVIEFITKIAEKYDEKVKIGFHGGEPLLNYTLIAYLIKKLRSIFGSREEIVYYLTTNGTINNSDIIDLIANNFNLRVSLSVDGKKKYHDQNRKFLNGTGSFEKVLSSIDKFIQRKIQFRLRMTVTNETASEIFNNFVYFYEMGAKNIAFIPDLTDLKWSKIGLEHYYKNLRAVISFLRDHDQLGADVFIRNLYNSVIKGQGLCKGGIKSFNIDVDGYIYPCIFVTGDRSFKIGDLVNGLDEFKLAEIQKINTIRNSSCLGCKIIPYCEGNICKVINKKLTGSYNTPSAVLCRINNMKIKVLKEFKD